MISNKLKNNPFTLKMTTLLKKLATSLKVHCSPNVTSMYYTNIAKSVVSPISQRLRTFSVLHRRDQPLSGHLIQDFNEVITYSVEY